MIEGTKKGATTMVGINVTSNPMEKLGQPPCGNGSRGRLRLNPHTLVLIALIFLLAGRLPVQAAQCLKDNREVVLSEANGDNHVIRLREYLCRPANADAATIRVQFHRLSDVAASALLGGKALAPFREIFGTYRLMDNDVSREFRLLLSRFGHEYGYILELGVDVPAGGTGTESAARIAEDADTLHLKVLPGNSDMPLLADLEHIHNELDWPKDFRFFYTLTKPFDPIQSTELWRFARLSDLGNYAQNLRELSARLGKNAPESFRTEYVRMMQYITSSGIPSDFLLIRGGKDGCGDASDLYFNFSLSGRVMMLDVAVIENSSDQTIHIKDLIGNNFLQPKLRAISQSSGRGSDRTIALDVSQELRPGERLVIPTRIFARAELNNAFWNFDDKPAVTMDKANQIYRAIRGRQSDTPLGSTLPLYPPQYTRRNVRKMASSFGVPSVPSGQNYAYGPELAVAGLIVDGQRMEFEGTSANFLNMTLSSQEGSCPILYVRDEQNQTWRRHGKIIHNAQTRAKQESQLVRLKGLVTNFRLAEEELEIAYIDEARLTLEIAGGRNIELKLSDPALRTTDNTYVRLYAGDQVPLAFELPGDVNPDEVSSSTLSVTGYYDRYSSLLFSARTEMQREAPPGDSNLPAAR